MTEFEKITPGEIKARLAAGREVWLWEPDDDHIKVTSVSIFGNAYMGIDSTNATIYYTGSITGRPCQIRVNESAKMKVVKEDPDYREYEFAVKVKIHRKSVAEGSDARLINKIKDGIEGLATGSAVIIDVPDGKS